MTNNTKKVIILNKLSSPFVSEAIIILKDGVSLPQSSVVAEAESIVRNYMIRTAKNGQSFKKNARLCSVKTTLILCAFSAALTCISCYLMLQ